jgi:hypothetical protein
MNTVCKLTKKLWTLFFLVSIPLIASCATVVTFDVEHPPLVDLRGVNTITVIPFEWNSAREYTYLSQCVTAALINGTRWGDIEFINPYTLENNRVRSYRQFADVYITGRIINVYTYEDIEIKDEIDNYQTTIRELITGNAFVDIEYSYIRSADNKMLGNFKKRSTADVSFENTRYRDRERNPYQNRGRDAERNTNRNTNSNANRNTARRRSGQARGAFLQRGTWQESMVETAIRRFSDTMNHEIGPWTTTESRRIKGRTGDNALAAEARSLVEQNRYDEAIVLYKTIYEQNGNIFAGYNAAILYAANEQFADALALLERLRDGILKEGKTVPAFIKNEIKKITEFVNGSKVLEMYPDASIQTAAAAAVAATAAGSEITGTVNVNPAMVYALNGQVSSINDNSIFTKMVAYADAVDGRWSLRLPDTAPALLWLLVTDGRRDYYITKTAVNFSGSASGAVALNTAEMTKLTN